ncbi:2'-5' RNA ligase family protein [Bdellovibrio sp. HCB337]|uniref:2'-5' RNA ligase family protein n=1 Tax=Bdellovibrio sp. HCB337 TaxID=3394358 RepID=UPI0039A5C6BA
MAYAIKCYFSEETATPIRRIWKDLADSGLAEFLKQSGSRPGITLGTWENAPEGDLIGLAGAFAEVCHEVPRVLTYGLATFPTDPAHVFLGVVPSDGLLGFHKRFHALDPRLSAACSLYYQPGSWVPHSTLAIRCNPKYISKIMERCLAYETRMEARIDSIGVVEIGTARQISDTVFHSIFMDEAENSL